MSETITKPSYEEGFTAVSEGAAVAIAANGGSVRITDRNGKYRFLVRWPIGTMINRPTPDQHHKFVVLPDGWRLVFSHTGWHYGSHTVVGSDGVAYESLCPVWYGPQPQIDAERAVWPTDMGEATLDTGEATLDTLENVRVCMPAFWMEEEGEEQAVDEHLLNHAESHDA